MFFASPVKLPFWRYEFCSKSSDILVSKLCNCLSHCSLKSIELPMTLATLQCFGTHFGMSISIRTLLMCEFSYFKVHPLLIYANRAQTACLISKEKHWLIEWDSLKQPHMSLRSPCPMPSSDWRGLKPHCTRLWSSGTVFSGVMELHPIPVGWACDPELIIQHQYLTSLMLNQILTAMFQHLVQSLPRRVEAVTAAKGDKLPVNALDFRRNIKCVMSTFFGHKVSQRSWIKEKLALDWLDWNQIKTDVVAVFSR